MESELKQLLEQCQKQNFSSEQMSSICEPLIWTMRWNKLKRCFLLGLPLLVIYLIWIYCDCFSWSLSALFRLFLIQVLPYWNWSNYYNGKCLIAKDYQPSESPSGSFRWNNCDLCSNLEGISTVSNVSYSMMESQFLELGLPVIVTDAELKLNLNDLIKRMQTKAIDLVSSEPCDVSSSLMLRQIFHLEAAIQKIRQGSALTKWHLHFRNCQSRAVKTSRLLLPRPYYYPKHLEPYYSSWLLMSHRQYRPQQEIYVKGLIFIQQLSGHFEFRLQPKAPCDGNVCPSLSLRLNEGEGLVYYTELWHLSYGLNKPDNQVTSIASVMEVDWDL
ncbi:uncharacterized protein Dwil_GK21690 [Drosophila willistoni]|uniref:GK21690 n=1 Tax=Drosophila willistoni TaxID=7260 RepID=B4MPE9_DROWI|nr:uncharacterized protein LOC6639960 [Drosophila willistoni]EDW73988.1 uncharacterized protein Dwil_GK21690 [Drosophila willistoni]